MGRRAGRPSGGKRLVRLLVRPLVIAAFGAATFVVSGSLLLAVPYLLLATSTAGVARKMWTGILAALVLGTCFGLWAASTDANGSLAFLWLLPLQLLLGILPFPLKADVGPVDSRVAGQGRT